MHTTHAFDDSGALTGTWRIDESGERPRVVCGVCNKFFGYLRQDKDLKRRMEAAYREQQRRRSCPGCGEEPFLG